MHVFGSTGKTTLEIHPTSPFVVLYGAPSDAQSTELTGTLVCNNTEHMQVKSIKVSLIGTRKVQWFTNTVTPQHISRKWQHFKQDMVLYPKEAARKQQHRIGPGNHEWHFKFDIPGDTDESVEGLSLGYVVYNLSAIIERGALAKDITTTKHIRIVRTLGPDDMEMGPLEQINEDIWSQKVAYRIIVPQKHYIIGTPITADFTLVPLKKGVEIGKVKMEVIEHMVLTNDYGYATQNQCVREHTVAQVERKMPENSERRVTPEIEALGVDALFDECYQFKMSLEIPKSLKQIRQSVESEHIKLVHKLRLYVNLKNPEGHTSQLLVKNQLHLFISPNLPPNEDQTFALDPHVLASNAAVQETSQNAPPTYGRHQLDSLYREIDPSDFQSAPGTRVHTPFRGLSRNPSSENLNVSIDTITESDGASASQLRSRLNNLRIDENGAHSPSTPGVTIIPVHDSSGGSTPHTGVDSSIDSRPPSTTEGYFPPPSALSYDMSELSRIPSYNTAVRTPVRTPIVEGLPTYEHVISQPPSPELGAQDSTSHTSPARTATFRGLDSLAEETRRNTAMNSRRTSPVRGTRGSDEQRR